MQIINIPAKLLVQAIKVYQNTLSLDHGPLRHLYPYGYCRHTPTCSQYAIEQITAKGAIIGSIKSIRRISACHPWRTVSDEKIVETIKKL